MIKIQNNFDGGRFADKFGFDALGGDFWVERGILYCPSLPDLTDADIADCVITPVCSISPKSELVAAGETLEITVTGAAGDYIITIDEVEHPITIDETGIEVIELPAIDAGVYIIRGTGALSLCVAKVEVI